jgi:hypothetical protein
MSDYDKCIADGNTPAECKNILDHIGQPITTLLGQQECTPGTTYYSGNTLHQCSSSGTWGIQTCSSGYDPVANACIAKNEIGDACSDDSECASGHCMNDVQFAAAHTGAPPAWNATTTCITAEVGQGLNNLATGIAIGSAVAAAPVLIPSAYGVVSSLPLIALMAQNAIAASPVLQTAAAVATLSQLPAAIIACQVYGADSPQCQYAAMGITAGFFTNPIGTLQGLQTSAQQVQNVANQGLNELSYASSILNLPNAGEDWGWTLANPSSMGVQTTNQQFIQQAIENYMLSNPLPNYTSALYTQTEVLNQPGFYGSFAAASDPNLAAVVDEILQALGNPANYAGGMGVDDITQAIFAHNQPIYTQDLGNAWNQTHSLVQLAGTNPNLNPYGVATLGDFFGTTPGCVGNICYENAILLQATAATYGENTLVATFYDTTVSPPISHAAVLFSDNGILSVADPTHNVSGTLESYLQYLQSIGYSNNIQFVTEQIFIPKP